MGRAQWLLGGSMSSVEQSSRMVASKVPGLTEALNALTVSSALAGLRSRDAASCRTESAWKGGKTEGRNRSMDLASTMQ